MDAQIWLLKEAAQPLVFSGKAAVDPAHLLLLQVNDQLKERFGPHALTWLQTLKGVFVESDNFNGIKLQFSSCQVPSVNSSYLHIIKCPFHAEVWIS